MKQRLWDRAARNVMFGFSPVAEIVVRDRYRPAWPVTRRVGPEAALGARCVLIAVGDPDRTASDTFPEVFPA